MIKSLLLRLLRRPLVGALATGLLVAAVTPSVRAATLPATPPTVSLQGEGSWDPYREMPIWQNDLFGSGNSGLINLNYVRGGSLQARQDYVAGSLDYVISGVGFQSSELKQLKNGAKDIIDAPVFVGAMGFLLVPAITSFANGGFGVLRADKCDPNDPNTPDPNLCYTYYPYTGPVRVPNNELANMLGGHVVPWSSSDILSAFGIKLQQGSDFAPAVFVPSGPPGSTTGGPQLYVRSDPSEPDYYLQLFQDRVGNPNSTRTVSEQLPNVALQTRQGVVQEAQLLETRRGQDGGGIAVVPPSAIGQVVADNATQKNPSLLPPPPEWVEMQNAMGQWVTPTPASIDAAVSAGGDTSLYGLTNKVDGAYPLVWIDHLYAPAHGLSVDKTEALATVIRYLATAGQGTTAAQGDGQLSAPLVLQALTAANNLVSSNCTGPGALVVQNSDPGRYAPALPGMASIGPMLHCTAASSTPSSTATSTTSTTRPSTTSTTIAATSGGPGTGASPSDSGGTTASGQTDTSGSAASGSSSATGAGGPGGSSQTASGPTAAGANGRNAGSLAESTTPLPLPWAGGGLDRLTALVLGALLFWLLRKPLQRLIGYLSA